MVRGQAIFQEWFKDFENQYVLIGGTAASITMEEAGVPFRGTKDLDIVLHVEVLTPAFGQKFWEFVQAGGYQQKEGDPEKKPCLYRFQKPLDDEFPYMLELFSRVPDGLNFVPPGHLTPIPMDEQVSSPPRRRSSLTIKTLPILLTCVICGRGWAIADPSGSVQWCPVGCPTVDRVG